MRRSELLEKQIRRSTENERIGTTDGISSEEIYQYLTDGVRFLQRKIMLADAEAFRRTYEFDASGSESYALPHDIFTRNSIVNLAYSASGDSADYYPLERVTEKERLTEQGAPGRYLVEGAYVLVNRYPATGSFRLTYDAAVPKVDKRRATVSSQTTAGGALTALTLSGYTADDYALDDYLTIVDFYGTVKMRGIPFTAVNSGTGVVSILGSSYTYPSGSTIANGDYVCLGAYASSHPQIDDSFEDFLLTYAQRRLLKRDSSLDANDIAEELSDMWQDGVALYARNLDTRDVPIQSHDYFEEFL